MNWKRIYDEVKEAQNDLANQIASHVVVKLTPSVDVMTRWERLKDVAFDLLLHRTRNHKEQSSATK